MPTNESETKSELADDEIKEEVEHFEEDDENENDVNPPLSLEDLLARHGGDPKKLDLSRVVLVANLPSEFLEDDYEVFQEALLEMISSDFKVSREQIDAVLRAPKLRGDSSSENALCALISFKSKVHKHRMIAQKKVAEEKSALTLSAVDEIPREWSDIDVLALSDEVGELDEDSYSKTKNGDEGKKKERTREDPEEQKERDKKEREEFIKRYAEDDDDDIAYTTDWDGAPEFQWKICTGKNDHRKIILDNVNYSDLRDPFLYRAFAKAELSEIEFPQRYTFDGSKAHKGKITLTYSRDHYIMPTAMRSLIYIRSPNKRRIKIYLPQHEVTLKAKDDFEKRLGRVIEQPITMKQLVVKVLPQEFTTTIEKAIEWFPGFNISTVEQKTDGKGQPVAVITFATAHETIDAHSCTPFITIDDQKCHVFLMSIEVNKFYLSVFDKFAEKEAFRAKMDKRHEEERKERDKLKIRASGYKRKVDPIPSVGDKRGRWEHPRSTRVLRGAVRGSFRGTRGLRGGFRGAERAPLGRYETSSTYPKRDGVSTFRGSDRYHPNTRNAYDTSSRSSYSSSHDSGTGFGSFSSSAFDYPSRSSSTSYQFSPEKRRTYY